MRGYLSSITWSPAGRAAQPLPILKSAILKSAILPCLLLLLSPSAVAAQTRIRVEFKPDDECAVSTTAGNGRASVTYPRRTTEMRCAVPSVSAPAGDVELEVVLLPGQGRPVDAFPRLDWTERDGRWIGAGRLDGVPAFVRIAPDWGLQRWRTLALDVTVVAATALAILWSIIRGRA